MIKRLLVPLDGSELAEEALIAAGDLAESVDGTVIIVRAVPPPVPGRFYAPKLLEQVEDAQQREADAYLKEVAKRLQNDRLRVETHVLKGEAAPAIVQFAEREGCHMIVMCSHGMGGLAKQVFGSVSQKVLYASTRPVLIIRPTPAELEREEEFEERAADDAVLQELSARNQP